MEKKERLERVLALIRERGWTFKRCMEDGCESIDFEYRGVSYHIWEFHDGEWGVETEGKDIYDLAHEMSELALMEYGKPFGISRWLSRAPEHTRELWKKAEIEPRPLTGKCPVPCI